MDTLAKSSLQLLFPLYLFVLMFLVIFLSRRSRRISQMGFSAPRTFSTLLLMCYSTVMKACVEMLGFIRFEGPIGVNNATYYGWVLDPNVRYGHGFHGFMVYVSVVLLVFYIFPFSIVLFTPRRIVYRIKWGKRLIPMFDAFWAPFKPHVEIWLGFRCLLRIVLFAFTAYFRFPNNIFASNVIIICLLLLHYTIQPFSGKWQNHFEMYFMVNVVLLLLGLLFFGMSSNARQQSMACCFPGVHILLNHRSLSHVLCNLRHSPPPQISYFPTKAKTKTAGLLQEDEARRNH